MRYLIIVSLFLFFACVQKQQSKQTPQESVLFEEEDNIKCYQDEKGIYKLQYLGQSYPSPYYFIVGKDTIAITDMNFEKEANTLKLHIYQGNAGHYQYDFSLAEKPFLKSVYVIEENNKKADSLLINRTLPIEPELQQKINVFINK